MKLPTRCLVAVTAAIVATIALSATAPAQIPDKFTNLKVLPKDIGKRDLTEIMRNFSGALGQRCSFCHVAKDPHDLSTFDFAADDKDEKKIARVMMKMTGDINNTELAKLDIKDKVRVRCVTCHRGVQKPETLDNVIVKTAQAKGVEAAVAEYRELREKYYGSGSYDFQPGSLNDAAEQLGKSDMAGAITIVKLNLEFNPNDAMTHLVLGRLYMASGDKAAALASVQKSLELDPGNRWAKRTLEQIKASK